MSITESIIEFIQNPEVNQYFQNKFVYYLVHYTAIILFNLTSYSYIFTKFYKVLCYSKLTFEWLPMINPYIWPFSMFHVLTAPYFRLWARILPPIKFEKSSFDISGIIALEALNSILYFCVRFSNFIVLILVETEKTINLS
uniref:Photosystem I assembly protein Ycf19 n=1 Tax=Synura uvella TaxID=52557 RepID=A0A3G2QZ25_9STRA|nr:photosystem I assembly protein Ycf19 [Synura uvella]AYO28367.1 photosystem I assembly protein Ycf19 [Synura uvella]